ncbi:MAG: hypothetical protein ACYCTH_11940 [Cellulomonas sp.]
MYHATTTYDDELDDCVVTGFVSSPPLLGWSPVLNDGVQLLDQPFQWLGEPFSCADADDVARVAIPIDRSTTLASEAMGFLSLKVDPSLWATVSALAFGAGPIRCLVVALSSPHDRSPPRGAATTVRQKGKSGQTITQGRRVTLGAIHPLGGVRVGSTPLW